MIKKIEFDNGILTGSIGRNGFIKTSGVEVMDTDVNRKIPCVSLSPITSKGAVANCSIEIPLSAIPDVIAALKKAFNEKFPPLT